MQVAARCVAQSKQGTRGRGSDVTHVGALCGATLAIEVLVKDGRWLSYDREICQAKVVNTMKTLRPYLSEDLAWPTSSLKTLLIRTHNNDSSRILESLNDVKSGLRHPSEKKTLERSKVLNGVQ